MGLVLLCSKWAVPQGLEPRMRRQRKSSLKIQLEDSIDSDFPHPQPFVLFFFVLLFTTAQFALDLQVSAFGQGLGDSASFLMRWPDATRCARRMPVVLSFTLFMATVGQHSFDL
jgi:hypothetical protein